MKKFYTLICLFAMGAAAVSAAPLKMAKNVSRGASAPVTLPATNITPEGFTANWEAYPGASLYQVMVFEPVTVSADGEYAILQEDFSLVSKGSTVEPYIPDDMLVDLDELNWAWTPDWLIYLPVFSKGMVDGIVYSPYIDLTNDEGRFKVTMNVVGYAGAKVVLESNGFDTQTREFTLTENGVNTLVAEFDNGIHDTYLCYTDYGFPDDEEGTYAACYAYLDDITVSQQLSAGDTALRLVEVVETEEDSGATSHDFPTLQYRYDAHHLAYDVMAISVYYNDPEDPWDYDVSYSAYSDLQLVDLLAGVQSVATDDADAPAQLFNLSGQAVDAATAAPGFYIRRQGNRVQKIVIQ